jgi:hypothetical protein
MEIDRAYLVTALALAIIGMLLGIYMGIAADLKLQAVHTALMLTGFVTLAIYGFIVRLWPAMKKTPLAHAQFWTATAGAGLLIIGSYFYAVSGSVPLAAVGSILFVIAAAMMLWQFWTVSQSG